MSAIMKIRQARSPEQIAEALEPMAESMAALADQLSEAAKTSKEDSFQAIREMQQQASMAASLVQEQAEALQKTARSMAALADQWQKERKRAGWVTAALMLGSATLAATLATASVRWLAPPPPVQNILNPRELAQYLAPALREATQAQQAQPAPAQRRR